MFNTGIIAVSHVDRISVRDRKCPENRTIPTENRGHHTRHFLRPIGREPPLLAAFAEGKSSRVEACWIAENPKHVDRGIILISQLVLVKAKLRQPSQVNLAGEPQTSSQDAAIAA